MTKRKQSISRVKLKRTLEVCGDFLKPSVQLVVQEVLEAEMAEALGAAMPRTALEWQAYRPERIDAAVTEGKPVVLDFFADWCIPCHELDRHTFSHSEISAALSGYVRLKADMTRDDNETNRAVAERFGVRGVPTIIFLDSQGREWQNSRVAGFLPRNNLLKHIPT